ncbi:OB-fold protein [Paraflavitalea speifideaquila]|uniref:OB-fold protein n=1 Tax=Paraflavitalea speifideaquila TaxID=3076558 RepID=UPI0028E4F0B1|nr:hypothetical protein [Paraflavitalea speifideiaquila]
MRKKQLIIIGVIVVLVGVAIYAYREYHRTNESLATVAADYTVQANTLVNEFLANDSTAYNKYRNKILAVQGLVKGVDKVDGDCTIVLGDTVDMASSVRCLLDSAQVQEGMKLRRGDHVTVKGAITGFKKR